LNGPHFRRQEAINISINGRHNFEDEKKWNRNNHHHSLFFLFFILLSNIVNNAEREMERISQKAANINNLYI
jgi:hypothetical protein